MVAISAAMLPNIKAETIAPVIIINELANTYVGVLGAISFPTIVKIE